MSIPPLVCSTPPPPEQCEDDKDQEDFDLDYHLSPEEEEEESNHYNYNNFSCFEQFKSSTTKATQEYEISKDEACTDVNNENTERNNIKVEENNGKIILEDDIIEDLDLKIDSQSVGSTQKTIDENCDTNIKEKEKHSPNELQNNIPVESTITQQSFKSKNDFVELTNKDSTEDSITETVDEIHQSENNSDGDSNIVDEIVSTNPSNNNTEIINPPKPDVEGDTLNIVNENCDLDDFEDFDDFQFVSSVDKSSETVIDTATENPWQNDVSKDDQFGDFTANFGEVENTVLQQSSDEQTKTHHDPEDDFGDFDEFKSVENNLELNKASTESCDEVPVLNFQSSDSEYQIIERINKVVYNIFQEEIMESDDVFESKLESLLGETWSYLRQTDVRQPYIVNWNNSLTQKTLLKALCIDSRNILFGPKWSSSMPKYAANLSVAPLQPQKQTGQSNVPQSEINNSEKAVNKTWPDPFTADGQEFTYAEALLLDLEHLMATLDQMAHNHSTLKISELLSHACHTDRENTVVETGPTDLDVFEAAMSTKPDKIYSNTISIQPMRQINLPDTHIFTPTNSEIPRSKTIHYDNSTAPTVLLPQSVSNNSTSSQSTHPENDNDYWEFQDFRASDQASQSAVIEESKDQKEVTHKGNLILATQVLQPIKLEPTMPTLNWPDPGEVKETFDDFSDFISNLPSSSENQDEKPKSIVSNNDQSDFSKDEIKPNANDKSDDEFEMFQSATLPTCNALTEQYLTKPMDQAASSQAMLNKVSDFDIVFPKLDKAKPDNISNTTGPVENVLKTEKNSPILFKRDPVASTTTAPVVSTNILQPSVASPSVTKQNQQKGSQILQPLSLESYSQINWPNPGIDLQDLSRFNPVESLQSFKNDSNSQSKNASPVHSQKTNNQTSDEDIWGEFVSSKPKQLPIIPKKQPIYADDEEWTDFVSSPSINPQNGLNTISFNVHTNSNMQKSSNSTKFQMKTNEILDIPALNYITPKNNKSYNERHLQNL